MIEARHLTKRYGTTVAVDEASFAVKPGRVTGFLGPNGAGKSTTMRMILGLARLRQPASLRHQVLEADDVDVLGTDIEGIAGFGGDDRGGPEGAAQLADLGLQGVGRVGRLPVAPQCLDEPFGVGEACVGELGQRLPSSQPERFAQGG